MAGIRVVLLICLAACGLAGVASAADSAPLPAGARVGIVDLVTNDVTHYHLGKSELTRFMRTYRAGWDAAELIDDPLMTALMGAGFQPQFIKASEALLRERDDWIVHNPRAGKLPRGAMKELGRLMTEQNLAALIVVAPGANNEPEFDARGRLTALPRTLQGFGFATSDEPDGIKKPAIFDFTQFVVVASTGDGARFVTRDWGGNKLYDWTTFDPGENFKTLTGAQLAPMKPVLAEAIKTRITTRLMPGLAQNR